MQQVLWFARFGDIKMVFIYLWKPHHRWQIWKGYVLEAFASQQIKYTDLWYKWCGNKPFSRSIQFFVCVCVIVSQGIEKKKCEVLGQHIIWLVVFVYILFMYPHIQKKQIYIYKYTIYALFFGEGISVIEIFCDAQDDWKASMAASTVRLPSKTIQINDNMRNQQQTSGHEAPTASQWQTNVKPMANQWQTKPN